MSAAIAKPKNYGDQNAEPSAHLEWLKNLSTWSKTMVQKASIS